jgi:hypothetical protein
MRTEKLLFGPTYKNADEVTLNREAYRMVDFFLGERGEFTKRPGLEAYSFNESVYTGEILGMYWWPQYEVVIAWGKDALWFINRPTNTYNLQFTAIGTLNPANFPKTRAIFTTDGTYTYATAGGAIQRINSGGGNPALTDPDIPTNSTHVAWLDGYLICNSAGTNQFYWSDVNNSSVWTATSFASAAGNADYINALHVLNRRIYLFGAASLEIWENDGVNPFSRIPGGYYDGGCIAPYSVIQHENTFFWIDNNRRFVTLAGAGVQPIQSSFDKEVQAMFDCSDATGDIITLNGRTFLVWQFPLANRTFAYHKETNSWTEWGKWEIDSYSRWMGNCVTFAGAWGTHLVGKRGELGFYKLGQDLYSDAGDTIRCLYQSGHIDHGTSAKKRNHKIRFRATRGRVDLATSPKLMVRWRTDGLNDWSHEQLVDLRAVGNTDFIADLKRLGCYRTRQYEFSFTDNAPLTLIDVEEEFEVLNR